MTRIYQIFAYILLGAGAVGAGTGYFLYIANTDRALLAQEAEQAKQDALEVRQESEQAIIDANKKAAQADSEIKKAMDTVKALTEERQMIGKAEIVNTDTDETATWKTIIAPGLQMSMRYPDNATPNVQDQIIIFTSASDTWMIARIYDQGVETNWLASIASGTEAIFLANKSLWKGKVGLADDGKTEVAVLTRKENGTSTHILRIYDPPAIKKSGKTIKYDWKNIFSTIDINTNHVLDSDNNVIGQKE